LSYFFGLEAFVFEIFRNMCYNYAAVDMALEFIEMTDHAFCCMLCKFHIFKYAYTIQYMSAPYDPYVDCGPSIKKTWTVVLLLDQYFNVTRWISDNISYKLNTHTHFNCPHTMTLTYPVSPPPKTSVQFINQFCTPSLWVLLTGRLIFWTSQDAL